MKKLGQLCIFLLCISLTSCFELVEQISVNEDGTGEMTVTLNMFESKKKLQTFLEAPESMHGYNAPDQAEVEAFFESVVATVSEVEGISNVKSDIYYEDFIFSISGSFDNVSAMGEAVKKFTSGMSKGMVNLKNEYQYEEGIFKRTFESPYKAENYKEIPMMQRVILESAKMISVYRFEKEITGMTSADTQLSTDKKEARFESSLSDIVSGSKTINNEIGF